MDTERCRSLTRTVCLRYACDKIHRAQELLERFRFCDCSAVGGIDCQCTSKLQQSENSQGARSFNCIDRNAQTGGKIGKSANQKMHKGEENLLYISVFITTCVQLLQFT